MVKLIYHFLFLFASFSIINFISFSISSPYSLLLFSSSIFHWGFSTFRLRAAIPPMDGLFLYALAKSWLAFLIYELIRLIPSSKSFAPILTCWASLYLVSMTVMLASAVFKAAYASFHAPMEFFILSVKWSLSFLSHFSSSAWNFLVSAVC